MSDLKISQLSDGGKLQSSDQLVVARGASNVKVSGANINLPGCGIHRSTAQAIATNTGTPLSFDSIRWDTDSMVDLVNHPTRITINTAGIYIVTGRVFWAGSTGTQYRTAVFVLNGDPTNGEIGEDLRGNSGGGNSSSSCPITVFKFSVNDYVELYVYQGESGSLNVVGSATKPYEGAEFGAQMLIPT